MDAKWGSDLEAIDKPLEDIADGGVCWRALKVTMPLGLPLDAGAFDHGPAPAVADVPLRGQVLVQGAEVLAVRSAGVGALSMPVESSPNVPIENSPLRCGSVASVAAWRFDVGEFG